MSLPTQNLRYLRFQGKRENDLAEFTLRQPQSLFYGSNLPGHRQVPAATVNFRFRCKSGPCKFNNWRGTQFYRLFAE